MWCDCRLGCSLVLFASMPSVGKIRIMIIILCVRRSRRGCYGYSMSGRLGKEELVVFAFGLIGKFLDRTSSSASGKNDTCLSLCGLSDCELLSSSYGMILSFSVILNLLLCISIITLVLKP